MEVNLNINGKSVQIKIDANETLMNTLRANGIFSIKNGCETGDCGVCTALVDGIPVNTCVYLTAQADGKSIISLESDGEHPHQGWKQTDGLSAIQETFVYSGAIQCGFCTPAMVLATKELLGRNNNPTEKEVREAISGVMCRCTGYVKPVEAILHTARVMRGESTPKKILDTDVTQNLIMPKIVNTEESPKWTSVGKPEVKVDSIKLIQGKPAFAADIEIRDMLIGKILTSTKAHALLKNIDTAAAKALTGVVSVLTHEDLPRVVYSSAGQSDPIPGPLDMFSLDNKVRFVGDRVAFVAAETAEIADAALKLIKVEYEELTPIINMSDSLESEIKIHDESEFIDFADSDASKNLAAKIRIDIGDVEAGFADADFIFENEYEVPKVQQVTIEPHVVVTYWDENDRMVVRTATQVPFHARRILAPVLGLPVKRIRVIKPRIGGGFGGKQEVLIEDVAAHLTIATGRPVKVELSRKEEFISATSRHPMKVKLKTGVLNNGTITANAMYCLSDTGAYGGHALTVTGNTGHKAMALYVGDGKYRKNPNIQFNADVVYTNTPPSGAFRGYGVPQGYWPLERQMDMIANQLKLDPLAFRLKNALREGEMQPFSTAWSEGREPRPEMIETNGLEECVAQGREAIGWDKKYNNENWQMVDGKPNLRKGLGVAMVMQGTAIAYLDMGGASIKMNDDGSFNMLVGATDLGTGSDTVLAQMGAEVLGVTPDDFVVYSSDTDFTPFDVGAYASSTTYISGGAVVKAAEIVAKRIQVRAAMMLNAKEDAPTQVSPGEIFLADKKAIAPDGRAITFGEIGLNSLHHENQEQIMGVDSFVSKVAPPPFGAQFAEVTVDIETGQVTVDKLVMAVDSGVIINPVTAAGQIEGGMAQALGYAISEEMVFDDKGVMREQDLRDYHIYLAHEMPELETIFVQTYEPSHPFGVKAVAEIPMDGVAPAIGNAIRHASGAELFQIPATPERVWKALQK
jgi:putative selenate reductase molybdopterin-binding subunit